MSAMSQIHSVDPVAAETSSQQAEAVAANAKAVRQEQAKAADEASREARKAQLKRDSEAKGPVDEQKKEAFRELIKSLNAEAGGYSKSISFDVFEESGELYAKVINKNTNEVLKTIPSEEALDLMNRVQDMVGLLLDEEG
jgi:flagellar protein FlaG